MDCKINSVAIKLLLYKKMDKIIDGTEKLSANAEFYWILPCGFFRNLVG